MPYIYELNIVQNLSLHKKQLRQVSLCHGLKGYGSLQAKDSTVVPRNLIWILMYSV